VADGAPVEDGPGQAEAEADADQVELVCEALNCTPMSGRATLATARLRLATAATDASAVSTHHCRAGTVDGATGATGVPVALTAVPSRSPSSAP